MEPILTMLPRPAASLLHGFQRDFLRSPQHGLAGNIPQKINPPKVAIDLFEHAVDLLRLGDVAFHRDSPSSKFLNLARRIFQAGNITPRQHQIRPGFGQRDGHGAAHAAGGSGNQGDASGEIKQGTHGRRVISGSSFPVLGRDHLRDPAAGRVAGPDIAA